MNEEKKVFFFAETWLSCSSRKINLPVLGKFDVLFAKSEKNPIPSLKIGKFDFKKTLLERPFFRKKITLDFSSIFILQGNSI